jgi:sugar/nucleoside kinase (ribokinase family)
VAVSDAITDYIVNISEEEFGATGLKKGASIPVTDEIRSKISKFFETSSNYKKFPGGSPINTVQVGSNLGMRCACIGCVGNDEAWMIINIYLF